MIAVKELLPPRASAARSGLALSPAWVTIHNTANQNRGASAASHAAYLAGAGKNKFVSWHYVVDDKEIWRCIPEHEVAWHAGDGANGTGNRKSLSIEICENPESSLAAATDSAAQLAG